MDLHIQTRVLLQNPISQKHSKNRAGEIRIVKVKLNIDFSEILGERATVPEGKYSHFPVLTVKKSSLCYQGKHLKSVVLGHYSPRAKKQSFLTAFSGPLKGVKGFSMFPGQFKHPLYLFSEKYICVWVT